MLRSLTLLAILTTLTGYAGIAHAACSAPAGDPGDIVYNSTHDVMQYCDAADNWIAMVGGEDSGGGSTLPSDLMGWWKFEETSGTSIEDSSYYGHNGVFSGAANVSSTTGIDKNGLTFQASSSYFVSVPHNTDYNLNTYTLSLWVKGTSAPALQTPSKIIDKNTNFSMNWHHYSRTISCEHYANSAWQITSSITGLSADTWYHLACTYDGDDIIMYVNGAEADRRVNVPAPDVNTQDIAIGSYFEGNGFFFDGYMDDVRIYNRALTAAEIDMIYDWGIAGGTISNTTDGDTCDPSEEGDLLYNSSEQVMQFCNGTNWISTVAANQYGPTENLLGWWRMDDASGTTVTDSAGLNNGTWNDVSGSDDLSDVTTTGRYGNAINFTGGDQYIALPNSTNLKPTYPFNLSMWVYYRSSVDSQRLFQGDDWNDEGSEYCGFALLVMSDGAVRPEVGMCAGGAHSATRLSEESSTFLTENTWNHISVNYNSHGNTDIYINGTLSPSSTDGAGTTMVYQATAQPKIGSVANRYSNSIIDDIRLYSVALPLAQIQLLATAGGCNTVGELCSDGTIFAGNFGGENLYIMPCDIGQTWDGSSCSGSRSTLQYGSYGTARNINSLTDGEANTNALAAFGASAHPAADACASSNYGSRNDWFLPASDQMSYIYSIKDTGSLNGTFSDGTSGDVYWSSTEDPAPSDAPQFAYVRGMNDNNLDWQWKSDALLVRCLSGGNAGNIADCSGPEGYEGDLVYNSDEDVMQFCNGSHWIGIGKAPDAGSAPPTGCDNIGDECDDGSFYVGLSPDGNVPMYMTSVDHEILSTYGAQEETGNQVCDSGGTNPECWTGEANTAALAAMTDVQTIPRYCANLEAHGRDDWYLPSRQELYVMYQMYDSVSTDLNTSGDNWYFSSSESDSISYIWTVHIGSGSFWHEGFKPNTLPARCVRK